MATFNEANMWYNGGSAQGPAPKSAAKKAYSTPVKSSGGGAAQTPMSQPQQSGGGSSPMTPQGPSQEEINAIYDPSFNYLNQAEQRLRSDLPTYLQDIEGQFGVNSALAGSNKTKAIGQVDTAQTQGQQRYEDALAASRRLFNELQMGNQQRFGGASSAGLAASELQGRELQQNRAGLATNYNNTMQQIAQQRAGIESDYGNTMLQLNQQKQQSVNEVNRQFQEKLLAINQNRSQLESAKAQARLQALQEMRNQIFQINQQNDAFAKQVEAMRQQATMQLESQAKNALGYTGAANNATSQFAQSASVNPRTQFGVSGGGAQNPQNSTNYTGQIGYQNPEDQYTGLIYSPVQDQGLSWLNR